MGKLKTHADVNELVVKVVDELEGDRFVTGLFLYDLFHVIRQREEPKPETFELAQ